MPLTDEQRAFRLRKYRTCFASALDTDRDGYITTHDFEEIAKRFVLSGNLSGKKKEDMEKAWKDVSDNLDVKEGDKVTLQDYLASGTKLCEHPDGKDITKKLMRLTFDVVDTNKDGVISPEEFQVYFKCMGINESYAPASFNGIDSDHDGLITKDEFLAASIEFFYGLDQSSGARLFYGPLLD